MPNLVVEWGSPGVLLARVSGDWRAPPTLPTVELIRIALRQEAPVKSVDFDTAGLIGWDSRFVAFITQCASLVRGGDIEMRYDGLPEGARRLLRLAHAVPEKADAHHNLAKAGFFRRVGEHTLQGWEGLLGLFTFLAKIS